MVFGIFRAGFVTLQPVRPFGWSFTSQFEQNEPVRNGYRINTHPQRR